MKKRLNNLSIYRLIATLCVLLFHIFYIPYDFEMPFSVLLSKGVQGLTALSGFLYSQKLISDNKKFYLNNLIKLIVPALAVVLFIVSLDVICMAVTGNWSIMCFLNFKASENRYITQVDNYYYLGYIAICYLITPILQRNDKWSVVVSSTVIVAELAIGFFVGPAIIASCYIVGYYIGKRYFKTYTDVEEKYSYRSLVVWSLILSASLALYALGKLYSFGEGYFLSHLNSLETNAMATIFGIATLFFTLIALKQLNKYKGLSLFKYTDKLSLIIYLMNQAFLCGALNLTYWVKEMWLVVVFAYLFTIGASIFLQFISELVIKRINNYIQKPKTNEA